MARAPQQQRIPPKPKKYINFGKFKKLNTKVSRQALPENELAWLENLMIIGENNLQTVPAPLGPFVSIPGEVTYRSYWANINNNDYIIVFTTAGGGWAINRTTNALVQFAPDGTFSNPDMTVYASERILIIDPNPLTGYSTWDGVLFIKTGQVSPNINITNGGTYNATPTVTISGGSGSGASAVAIMGGTAPNQFVGQVELVTGGTGYQPGDILTVTFSTGTSTATAVARVWPQVTGTSIGVFAGRVWWISAPMFPVGGNVRQLNFTGLGAVTVVGPTYDDTNPANAAGSTTITDADVAHNLTCVRGLNNYLYIFGDNSIKQIGSITVSNSTTLFTILTIASDIGTTYIQTILSYNRYVVFANKNGVYGIFGASVQKISDDLDGLFQQIDFTQQMSAALNDVHLGITVGGSIHCYLVLVKYNDPIQGARSLILGFDGKTWFTTSQGNNIIAITSLPGITSLQWETYGLASPPGGGSIQVKQLLADDTSNTNVTLITSLTPHNDVQTAKQPLHIGIAVNFGAATVASPLLIANLDTENGTDGTTFLPPGGKSGFALVHQDMEGYGHYLGLTLSMSAQRSSFNAMIIEYVDADIWGDTFPAPVPTILTDETGKIILTKENP